ncbi:unnamed protein product, partial [Brassica oleracea]
IEENERDAERYEYERDTERDTERDRSPCYEEARVERNVRDFVDEDVDLDDPKIMPKEILVDIQKRWELTVTIDQCRNAKTRALEMIKEENDQQFSRLKDYRLELLE